ncbi:Autophagy protein 7 [Geranomyces variabilis]|uniref:Ubiquitin-like modifier-activating enzyme ATG7 n=1 Tax=Geranomyces variabilis TaxID=109894 RepID=A0AAD5TP64_9FUNG|nr:Autophagy protein 7 [Geranomyces variabilis]
MESQDDTATNSLLQFDPLESAVDPTFWHALSKKKIEVYRLSDAQQDISAQYQVPAPHPTRNAAAATAAAATEASARAPKNVPAARLSFSARSFDDVSVAAATASCTSPGVLRNTNTIEEFKQLDKTNALKEVAERIWADMNSGAAISNPSLLTRFLLVTFADLKKYRFYYWFAFPALLPEEPIRLSRAVPMADVYSGAQISALRESWAAKGGALPFFLLSETNEALGVHELREWHNVMQDGKPVTVGFVDPSSQPANPGWPLRNFLILLRVRWGVTAARVICFRESTLPRDPCSIICDVVLPGAASPRGAACPKAVGWEKNSSGKLGPRMADLGPLMDPAQLADTAVDLNLKLMRWRIMPSLQLETITATRCLLLGSGTLGCYVARALLAWGVRNITFVDNGRVSFSNPVRQPLFRFEDCLDGGKPKAAAAASGLKGVFPGVNAVGVDLNIPMPGHAAATPDRTCADADRLRELIEAHDAVFLLTDSRESRWLPTVIAASLGKIVINSALGFDTFLVMRHGIVTGAHEPSASLAPVTSTADITSLGCYYCNDVVAPADSLSDRTLDQQCTVTRPGLSAIASATAVELLVSILNHPLRARAPAPLPSASNNPSAPTPSPLGLVPHQIRGFLTHFSNLLITGPAYDRCTACSAVVLRMYREEGAAFVRRVVEDPGVLEEVTGLRAMREEADAQDVDWDVEEGDDFEI